MSDSLPALQEHVKKYRLCCKCPLGCRTLTKTKNIRVFHEVPDNDRADILFVGEYAGESELVTLAPFTGMAGDLLKTYISETIDPKLYLAYTYLVICPSRDSPLGKLRSPKKKEIDACTPRLENFISIINPRCLVALGAAAKRTLSAMSTRPVFEIPSPGKILVQEEASLVDISRLKTTLREANEFVLKLTKAE